ncbi:Hpt domain-containing protein [Aliiroseovarius sp. PTFE2010]|uniref:Hpt domain-containing protein n=1 Tax=Aliiroseovarius sp. PTFE2010 TaxID=3417190 RepID=UPI003CE9A766
MIDWQRVEELRNEVGSEAFNEVVELFLEEVDETIARLRSDPDLSTLEEDLHFLKGSALNLGLTVFSLLCQKGEQMSASGHPEDVDVSVVVETFDESRAAFVEGCAKFPSAA